MCYLEIMKLHLKNIFVFSLVVLVCWASELNAQNIANPLADVPPPDELRFISTDDATSKCIGNPITPLCAVETFFACSARQDIDLCRKVGVINFSYPDKKITSRYRVLKAKVLSEDDMTEELKDATWWKPGFVDFTIFRVFSEEGTCPDECRFSYIANLVDSKWHVISWTWWGAQDPTDPGPDPSN